MSNIPVKCIEGDNLPDVWENSLVELWNYGVDIKTDYDNPKDPPSKDCTMVLIVDKPLSEPRIHREMCDGLDGLKNYIANVIEGTEDHYVREGKLPYTYHDRLFNYPSLKNSRDRIDQIYWACEKLADNPYSRRVQAITWEVPFDNENKEDQPCFVAGTKILTPNGYKNIENLSKNDAVYAFDLSKKCLVSSYIVATQKREDSCYIVKSVAQNCTCSYNQPFLTYNNKKVSWKNASEIGDSLVAHSTVSNIEDLTENMVFGYLCGDGWLSNNYNYSKNPPIKSYTVGFSIHPEADENWCRQYLYQNSDNKIKEEERIVNSELVKGDHKSRRILTQSKNLWAYFNKMGCPPGRKITGVQFSIDTNKMSIKDQCDFLTGIFSAEGSIIFKKTDNSCSIQISMNWKECIEKIKYMLENLNISFTYHVTNKSHCIHISKHKDIYKAVKFFDFRLDSRKQAKYYKLLDLIKRTTEDLDKRNRDVDKALALREKGKTIREIKEFVPNYNRRWLKGHRPSPRWKKSQSVTEDRIVWLPVETQYIDSKKVYDITIDHSDHTFIANGFLAHNCFQRLWVRMLPDPEADNVWNLNMNVDFRSNDAFKAAFMNMYVFIELQRRMADTIEWILQNHKNPRSRVQIGRYCHKADSYHIYGKYFEEFEGRFLRNLEKREFSERTWNSEILGEM